MDKYQKTTTVDGGTLLPRLTTLLAGDGYVSRNDRRNAELTAAAVLREIARTHDLVERVTLDDAARFYEKQCQNIVVRAKGQGFTARDVWIASGGKLG